MKSRSLLLLGLFFSLNLHAQKVVSIQINGSINPASAEYIHNSVQRAESTHAEALLIHLNTPGGLLSSTREIVSDFFNSTVPVIVFIYPAGAHAGSAGTFITMAANIAAMATGTNIGAAHPVTLQGSPDSIENEKGTNDAAAFIRTIAQKRHRNAQWAEEAVRNSVSLTEEEAIQDSVIDYIANDDRELLTQIDGLTVQVAGGTRVLHTRNATLDNETMGFFQRILDLISNPNIAYMLMMLGFFGILFELFNPGAIFPGIAGVIFLVLAFYSMSSLPVNYAGLALVIFGIVLFLLEIKIPSHGLLTIGGIVSLLLGSMFLIRATPSENIHSISRGIIVGTTAAAALFFTFVVGMGIKAQRLKPVSGNNSLVGKTAEALGALNPEGMVSVNGEMWQAESLSGPVMPGESVRVREVRNFKLMVEKVS